MAYDSTIARLGGGKNISQMVATVRDRAAAGGGSNTALLFDPYWADSELIANINEGLYELWKVIKNLRQDLFMEIIASTESAIVIGGISYDPTTALRITANVHHYTLPPDFGEMKEIRAVTTDREATRFVAKDRATEQFRAAYIRSASEGAAEYYYDIVGRRTLVIAPAPPETLDIEIAYMRRPRRMRRFSAGTIGVTNDSAAVTGSGTGWVVGTIPRVVPGAQIIVGTTVDVNEESPIILSVDSATAITLASNYLGDTNASTNYTIADAPELELENTEILEAYALQLAFRKGSTPNLNKANAWMAEYRRLLPGVKTSFAKRQIGGPEFVEAYLEDTEGAY